MVAEKKIGFILSSGGWGGLEMNVLALAGWMRQREWDITFFAPSQIKAFGKAEQQGFRMVSLSHRKYADIRKAYSFSRQLRKESLNTIILFNNQDLDFIFFTKIFYPALKVVYQQHMQIGVNKKDLLHSLRFAVINWWISPLEKLKEEVIAKTNVSPQKIKVIPLGLEIKKFYPPILSRQEARAKLLLPFDALVIGILGRIDPKKGQFFIVKALKELVDQGQSIHLLIMGETTIHDANASQYLVDINKFISANNLAAYVSIRGFSNEVTEFFQAINVFALASEAETYGMVTIEAMVSGVPVIATASGGTVEILQNGALGILYEYNNFNDFCSKLIALLNNEKQMKHFAEKAQSYAFEQFSHTKECFMLEELLREKTNFDQQ